MCECGCGERARIQEEEKTRLSTWSGKRTNGALYTYAAVGVVYMYILHMTDNNNMFEYTRTARTDDDDDDDTTEYVHIDNT